MRVLAFPLRYLKLLDERGRLLVLRDLAAVLLLTTILSVPFIATDANFFAPGGFLERFGSFSSVLTGFYIAALVGIATFASVVGDLDLPIQVGRIFTPEQYADEDPNQDLEGLTRREYVCAMFGYLAFLSLGLSIGAIAGVILACPVRELIEDSHIAVALWVLNYLPSTLIVVVSVIISHMVVTTCYGLYYLIDRLYATSPKVAEKPEGNDTPR